MLARSPRFDATIATSHTPVVTVEVLDANGLAIADTDSADLKIIGGDLTFDRAATYRGSLKLELADPNGDVIPKDSRGLFSVLSGHQLRVGRGVRYPDGTQEVLRQGVFGLAEADGADTGKSRTLSITAYDSSRALARAEFTKPYVIQQGKRIVDTIIGIVLDRKPGTVIRNGAGSVLHTTTFAVLDPVSAANPLKTISDLADAGGLECFYDWDDAFVIQPVPDPSATDPSWLFLEGEHALFDSITKATSNENSPNGVIAYGQSSYGLSPVKGEAWDENPLSPTYSGHQPDGSFFPTPYGAVPLRLPASNYVSTQVQADDAAAAKLRQVLGASEVIDLSGLCQPALRASDVIWVQRPVLGVQAAYVLDRFVVPLTAKGKAAVRTRQRWVAT